MIQRNFPLLIIVKPDFQVVSFQFTPELLYRLSSRVEQLGSADRVNEVGSFCRRDRGLAGGTVGYEQRRVGQTTGLAAVPQ